MLSLIVNHIKGRLGATHRRLELDDDQIVQLLQEETLNTLSVYFPFFLTYKLDLNESRVEGSRNEYYVPMDIEGYRLMGVEKVIPSTGANITGNGMAYGILGTDMLSSMTNFLNTKLAGGMTAAMLPPETFEYRHPGMLRLHNVYTHGHAVLMLKTTHRSDFGTLAPGLLESVKKLALADVANDLLGIRQYFQNVGTTFGEINLNLDTLQRWADSRDDLIETFRKNQLKNSGVKKMYMC
jgi:hypothetical protein